MTWRQQLCGDALTRLLSSDLAAVRYLALRDLLDAPADDPELLRARAEAHRQGPIADILAAMHPDGYWAEPGPGYNPKYRSTVWSLIMLAQLGAAAGEDERIGRACAYLLDHALCAGGQFSISGAPSYTVDCLQGNLLAALCDLGYEDPRLEAAWEWMARTVTADPARYRPGRCVLLGHRPRQRRLPLWLQRQAQRQLVQVRLSGLLRHRPVAARQSAGGAGRWSTTMPARRGWMWAPRSSPARG